MADSYKTEHGTRYRARWYDENGRRRTKAGFVRLKAAEDYENDRDSDKRNMRAPDPEVRRSPLTLNDFFEWWADNDGPHSVAAATYNSYTWAYNAHARRRIGHHRLTELVLKPHIVRKWRADVAKATDKRTGKALKPTTVRGAHRALSAILTAAVAEGHLPRNPLHAETQGRRRRSRSERLAEVAPETRDISMVAWCLLALVLERRSRRRDPLDARLDAAMVRVGFMSGLRMPSEVVGLRWKDIGEQLLAVEGRVSEGEWEPVTKTLDPRTVPLWRQLAGELAALRDAITVAEGQAPPRDALIWHLRDQDDALLPWSSSMMNNWRSRYWRPAAEVVANTWPQFSELAEAVPYDGRAAWVSTCAAANIPLLEIARNAGHSVTMTERIYGRIIRERAGKAASPPEEQLDAAIAEAANLYDEAFPAVATATDSAEPELSPGSSDGSSVQLGSASRRRNARRQGPRLGSSAG